MKRSILLLLILPVLLTSADQKEKKFKVTFTVIYNKLTLTQAAAKEKEFRERYKDACSVDVKLDELLTVSDARSIYWQYDNRLHTPYIFNVCDSTVHIKDNILIDTKYDGDVVKVMK